MSTEDSNSAPVFDDLVDIYGLWASGDKSSTGCWHFYQQFCAERAGEIIELGVGLGDIAIHVAARCKNHVVGIDSSPKMLEACRQRAASVGVLSHLELVLADLRQFQVHARVPTVILPYRTIGHLVERADRQMMFERVHAALLTGGLFVVDHRLHDAQWALTNDRVPQLMYSGPQHPGRNIRIWNTYRYSFESSRMVCAVTIEEINDQGSVATTRHVRFPLSWVEPTELRAMAERMGFVVEAVYGGFERQALTPSSTDEVLVLRRK